MGDDVDDESYQSLVVEEERFVLVVHSYRMKKEEEAQQHCQVLLRYPFAAQELFWYAYDNVHESCQIG